MRVCDYRGSNDDAILEVVRQHVPSSTLSTRGGTELAFKLPRDKSSSFATLLSELEKRKAELGVLSCGLSVTTLEEVFLKVSAGSAAALDQKQAAAQSQPQVVSLPTDCSVLWLETSKQVLKRQWRQRSTLWCWGLIFWAPWFVTCLWLRQSW